MTLADRGGRAKRVDWCASQRAEELCSPAIPVGRNLLCANRLTWVSGFSTVKRPASHATSLNRVRPGKVHYLDRGTGVVFVH